MDFLIHEFIYVCSLKCRQTSLRCRQTFQYRTQYLKLSILDKCQNKVVFCSVNYPQVHSMNILVNTPETKRCLPLLHRSKSLPVATIRALDKYTQNMKAGCAVNLPTVSIVSSKQIRKPSKKTRSVYYLRPQWWK